MAIASELTINSASALQMAETIFGNGIKVTDASYTGDANSAGIYSGATSTIPGIVPTDSGVILSTGRVADFTNSSGTTDTNVVANRSTNTAGVDGDSQLNALAGLNTFDGSILQATFIPDGDVITMQFVFSSEEYPEYVNSNFNDAFGVWVNGSFVPATISVSGPVAVDEVNAAKNENFYRTNTADQFNTEMDGFTYVLSIKAAVIAGASNTIKIAIADGGDAAWDSNLLILADSVQTVTLAIDDTINITANSSRTFDILANDASKSGAPLTITQIMGQDIKVGETIKLTSGQLVRLNADGTITVFSNAVLGQENFSYTVSDGTNTETGYVHLNTGATQALDGIVSGTSDDDQIDATYKGDPDGDFIDNNDATGVQGTKGNADVVYAGAGNDTIIAGDGNDILYAGTGDDSVFGGAGDDRADLGDGNDTFGEKDGGKGDAGLGNDTVFGGLGEDSIWAGEGNDSVSGGTGRDVIFGGDGNDTLGGGGDADEVFGDAGSDTISGGAGDGVDGGEDKDGSDVDVLKLSDVKSIVFGGGDNETGTVTFNDGGTLGFTGIEAIQIAGAVDGTSGGDAIAEGYIDAEGDQRDGGDGLADTVYGYGGDDSIDAGDGNDTVYGGSGHDTLLASVGNDVLMGEDDADTFQVSFASGTDTIIGGDGGVDTDTLSLSTSAPGPGYTVTLTGQGAGNYGVAGGASGTFAEIEDFALSGGADTFSGAASSGAMSVSAGAGNDTISGGSGADILAGDAGSDMLTGGAGNDILQGGADADTVHGGAGDVVDGGETATNGTDNDVLIVEAGSTVTYGGGNNEAGTVALASGGSLSFTGIEHVVFAGPVDGTAGADVMAPGYTDLNGDQIDGTDGINDTIFGYGGNDSITAGAGADRIDGGDGDDTIAGGAGADTLQGGSGLDLADYSASAAGVYVDLNDSVADGGDATGDVLAAGIDGVIGSAHNDTLTGFDAQGTTPGNAYTNVLYGAAGDDFIDGLAGNDSLYGGTGNDTILGGAGADTLTGGDDADFLFGGSGDLVDGGSGGQDNDTLTANDVVSVAFSSADQEAGTLTFADGSTLAFSEIEHLNLNGNRDGTVVGTAGDDLMNPGYVDANGDIIEANDAIFAGNSPNEDWIFAEAGNDTVNAGVENDHVYGGSGEDSLRGGTGDDYLEGGSENDVVYGEEGNDFQRGDAGNDTVYGGVGNDSVYGGRDDDRVFGESGNDYVSGGLGNDTVYGGTGNDTVMGASDDDLIYGDDGNDSIEGSDGNDTIYGGAGDDSIYGWDDADTIYAGKGDVVDGGEGVTDGADNDTLFLTDTQSVVFDPGFPENGVVTFTDGTTLKFFNIENLYLDGVLTGPPDLIVDGTSGSDLMKVGYVDAQGDIIDGADGLADTIYGYAGNDSITAGEGADLVHGGQGNDSLAGGTGNDTVLGGTGNDALIGDAGDDSLAGGEGDDRFVASDGFGADTVIGGETSETAGDTLDLSQVTQDLTLDLSAGTPGNAEDGTVSGGSDGVTFSEIEQVTLGSGNDAVIGSSGDDRVTTGAGRDTVGGGAGNDLFALGSDGEADLVRIGDGEGADTLTGFDGPVTGPGGGLTGVDRVDVSAMTDAYGNPVDVNDVTVSDDGQGNARLTFPNGESLTLVGVAPATAANPAYLVAIGIPPVPAPDYIVEGTGGGDLIDASYTGDPEGDRIDAADDQTGTNDDVILAGDGDDTVLAGQGNDSIEAEAGNDLVDAGAGDDTVHGGTGDDMLHGQGGNDSISGDDGADSLSGWEGNDTLSGGGDNDRVDGDEGDDRLYGDAGDDTLVGDGGADALSGGTGNDALYAGAGNDTVHAGSEADTVEGGQGNDLIEGEAGADLLFGGDGHDQICGGTEDDTISGGIGDDTLAGGAGDDMLSGEIGADTIYGGNGSDSIEGGEGNDLIVGSDPDGSGDDTLSGGTGDDTITGGSGMEADTIYGGDGNDVITAFGGTSDEDIYGGAGNDTITTGGGDFELVYGGDDRDTFVATSDASMQLDGGDGGDDVDTLDLSALGKANTEIVYTSPDKEDGYVRILDANGGETGRIDFTDIENVIPCFTPGTRVQTDTGLRQVEDLRPGDRVLTRDDGYQLLRWTGRRDLAPAELAALPAYAPVRIAAGAMGEGMPRRDMMVSPQHRMLMTGRQAEMLFGEAEVLVAALHLVGRPGFTRAEVLGVSYIHLLFDHHQILQADGVWTESFQPGAATLGGMDAAQRDEVLGLFPELAEGALYAAARITLKAHEVRVLMVA